MAYSAFVGSFNLDSSVTAGNDQSVTGVGFQPKIVLFWWSGSTATGDSVAGGNIAFGYGVATDSTHRWALTTASTDAAATSDTYRYDSATECIRIYSAGDGTLDGLADFKSMDAGGFTLTIDDQFSADYRISYLALGGTDLTNVAVGSDARDGDLGNHAVTGVGFQPEVVLLGLTPGAGATATISLGMATGSSNQGVVTFGSLDAQATSDTAGYGYNGECSARSGLSAAYRDSFVSFDADGFTLNQLETTATELLWYICLKGGQYEVGDLTTRTDGNDIEENLAGAFTPVAVLFASANRALSTQNVSTAHGRLSIGAASSTTQRCVQAISDEDNLADTETAFTNQDDAVYAHVVDDAVVGLMDLKSMDADGFTCVMDDTDPSACWVTYLAIGATATAGGVPRHMMHYARLRRA